jgi:hypothetical protein
MWAQHFRLPITGDLTTYMEPGDPKTGHSKSFTAENISYLWSQPPPAFFARKFLPTPKMDAALAARIRNADGDGGEGKRQRKSQRLSI